MLMNRLMGGIKPSSSITHIINYAYIKKKDIDEIKSRHGETLLQKIKMYALISKHIGF